MCISLVSLLNRAEQKLVILALWPRKKPITSSASVGLFSSDAHWPQLGCSHTFSAAKAGNDPPNTVAENPGYGSGGVQVGGWVSTQNH